MAKKKLYDEQGNEVKGAKVKKPFYKKVSFWIIAIVLIFIIQAVVGSDGETADIEKEQSNTTEVAKNNTEGTKDEEPEEKVSREFENALRSAENYVDIMPMSEKGLYKQLTSEAGEGYPEDAAQYAIDNVEVDYNEQALKSAINYQEIMPMSDDALLQQLTSDAGDQYTTEQAQYAVDNLPE